MGAGARETEGPEEAPAGVHSGGVVVHGVATEKEERENGLWVLMDAHFVSLMEFFGLTIITSLWLKHDSDGGSSYTISGLLRTENRGEKEEVTRGRGGCFGGSVRCRWLSASVSGGGQRLNIHL